MGSRCRIAPSTSDIQQSFSWLQIKLAEREIYLRDLRVLKRFLAGWKVRARIRHRRTEEEPKEVIREVVVRLDGLKVSSEVFRCHDADIFIIGGRELPCPFGGLPLALKAIGLCFF